MCETIFLGTPHLSSYIDRRWERWALIPKSNRKDISKNSLGRDDVANLIAACQIFDDIGLQVPILSIYETQETKGREDLLCSLNGKNRKILIYPTTSLSLISDQSTLKLVDDDLARTEVKYEQMFDVDATHKDLINVPVEGPLF